MSVLSTPKQAAKLMPQVVAASSSTTSGDPFSGKRTQGLAKPPSLTQRWVDRAFLGLCRGFAWGCALFVGYIILQIAIKAQPAMAKLGVGFLTGTTWDPNQEQFSILPEIWGTLYSSVLALGIATVLGVAVALFLSEGFLGEALMSVFKRVGLQNKPFFLRMPDIAERVLRNLIELLAAIPSVVYGLWGLFVVIPVLRAPCAWLYEHLNSWSLFSTPLSGPGMLPAVLVLSIMLLPTITALSRDALVAVPAKLRMAAYGMGATRWETIMAVNIPTAARGIFGAVVIAFGRALGETMALAMLVGNANRISVSLFSPANTLAALLANSFPEAGPNEVAVLMYAALVLLGITMAVNILGSALLLRASRGQEGLR
ncbi:MAG: Phosphate transport system permease protein PstC [Pseudomonadota bacterium]